jgi:hypothetical protein
MGVEFSIGEAGGEETGGCFYALERKNRVNQVNRVSRVSRANQAGGLTRRGRFLYCTGL